MCSNILRTRHSSKSKLKASKANQTILDLPGRQRASDVGGARRRDGAGEGEILMGPLSHLEVTGEPYLEDCGEDQVREYARLGTAHGGVFVQEYPCHGLVSCPSAWDVFVREYMLIRMQLHLIKPMHRCWLCSLRST